MKASSLNISNVRVGDIRIDPEYHLSDGVRIKRIIKSMPYPICSVQEASSRIFYGGRAKRVYVNKKENGIPLLTGSAILLSDLNNLKLASKKLTPGIEEMKVKKGWILISRSGSVGNTAYANASHAQNMASEDVIRVCPNEKLKGGYLYAYLASTYGYSLLSQGTFGAVIQHIEPDFIGAIPIPQFPDSFQKEVDDLIQESAKLREEATSSLRIAISLFEQKNVDYFINNTNSKHKIVSISNIINNHKRLDSTYQLWLSDLSNYNQTVVQRHTCKIQVLAKDIFIGNRGKRNYTEQGIPFISSSDMMLFNPIKYAKRIGTKTPNLSSMLVKQGDILISRSGTVGNTALVSNTLLDCAVSEHAMRLRIAEGEITPEYIFCYFNTKEGKRYLENLAYGSVIITLGEEFVGDIDLPILSDDAQREITKHIRDYSIKIDTAIELENKATNLIEAEIEKWNN